MAYTSNLINVMQSLSDAEIRALEKIGIVVEGSAIARSSVGQYRDRVGGQYKASWGHEINENNKSVAIGNSSLQSIFVEYGTGRRGDSSWQGNLPEGYQHGAKPGMQAQRTLTGSMEENEENVKNIILRELGDMSD